MDIQLPSFSPSLRRQNANTYYPPAQPTEYDRIIPGGPEPNQERRRLIRENAPHLMHIPLNPVVQPVDHPIGHQGGQPIG